MVDTGDLKSLGRIGRAGSSPAEGTKKFNMLFYNGKLVVWGALEQVLRGVLNDRYSLCLGSMLLRLHKQRVAQVLALLSIR